MTKLRLGGTYLSPVLHNSVEFKGRQHNVRQFRLIQANRNKLITNTNKVAGFQRLCCVYRGSVSVVCYRTAPKRLPNIEIIFNKSLINSISIMFINLIHSYCRAKAQ